MAERAAGNEHAKDWQDEARKLVEREVSNISYFKILSTNCQFSDGKILEDSTSGTA